MRQVVYALRAWFEFRGDPLPEEATPLAGLPSQERVDFLTMKECRALLKAVDPPRDHAVLTALLYSGIRAAEAAALKVKDVDFDRAILHRFPRRTLRA